MVTWKNLLMTKINTAVDQTVVHKDEGQFRENCHQNMRNKLTKWILPLSKSQIRVPADTYFFEQEKPGRSKWTKYVFLISS